VRAERRRWLLSATLTLVLLVVIGFAAIRYQPHGSTLAAWWPTSGIAVAFLARSPRAWRPLFLAAMPFAVTLAALWVGRPLLLSVTVGVANSAGALVVILLLARRSGDGGVRLQTLEDLWLLLVATLAGSVVVGVLVGAAIAWALGTPLLEAAPSVTALNAASVLLIAPLGMDVSGPRPGAGRGEGVAQCLLALLVLAAVFAPGQELPVDFLPIPLLLWGAMRLPARLVTVQLLVAGVFVSVTTRLGYGPIAHDLRQDNLAPEVVSAVVQAYLVCLALVVLPLVLSTRQRLVSLEQAQAGEERFRRSFSDSLIGMLLLRATPAGLVVDEANGVAATLLGADREQLLGRPWGSGLHDDERDAMQCACAAILEGRSSGWVREVRLGSAPSRWVRLAASALDRPGGRRMLSVQLVDLTAERLAQGELERERDFTAAVLDTANTLIVVLDEHGSIVRFNRAAEKVSGLRAEDVLGSYAWDVFGRELGDLLGARLGTRDPALAPLPSVVEDEWVVRGALRRTVAWSCAYLDEAEAGLHMVMTGIDVTDERLAQRLVDQVLAATTGTSIIGTNPDGLITFFNPGAERLLGWTAEEVVGKVTPAIFHDPDELVERSEELGLDSTFGVLVAGVETERRPEKRDWRYIRKDGRKITMSLTISPMTSPSGRVVGYLGVAEDVTERRRVEDMLRVALSKEREAVERLNEVDRAKTDFVSTVSHELRTPITSVLGYTQMLMRGTGGGLREQQARLLGRVESNGLRLQALIEDLLTLSRIEAGTFSLRVDAVDLRRVVQRSSEATEALRHHRRLEWVVEPGDVPVVVSGDEDQLDRALTNLVTNAVKFTEDPGRVRLSLATVGESALLTVEDTGIGIPHAEQARLFERFFRSVDAQQRAIPGTGLGLSIVRSIVHGHGGTVAVSSQAGRGTRFEVRLPLLVGADASERGAARAPRSGESAHRG
jgi:PAS domain S-box-containing protein